VVDKIDFFEGVKNHFESLDIKIIEVPEWGLEGDKAIYVRPFTMNEKAKLFKGANDSDLSVLVDVIIQKAETQSGDKMFDLSHKPKFKMKADTDVISRVASAIMSQDNITDLKKN
tara:strand:- start:202 stop:546 length:345 start_codon:yes stop_codon:yes gene_type:complete